MSPATILPSRAWAERTFGRVDLRDPRRTRRLVDLATAMMRRPNASLPAQLRSPASLKAAYRLLAQAAVTPDALLQPHTLHTRQAAALQACVLLIQDTTELDYTAHPKTTGLGPIGDGHGSGFLLHTVLAVLPTSRQLLGLLHQEPFRRPSVPLHSRQEHSQKRKQRARESQVWPRAVAAVGSPPSGSRWVHVGDRGSDLFDLMEACQGYGCDFLLRAAQDRRVTVSEQTATYLLTWARQLPAAGQRSLALPARHGKAAREVLLSISWGAVTVQPPVHAPGERQPIPSWVVRVWEATPPAGEEPIEWVLVTSVATGTLAEAWERVGWYTARWLIEEYHQCLKTGCALEERQLHSYAGLTRLLGLQAPIAVRLLQLREIARRDPERLAAEVLPREVVAVVAMLAEERVEELTANQFWREVGRQGGHLGRRRDGPPGWQTLWRGWLHVQTLLEGIQLAAHLPPSTCG
jgi:Transposase DNA-binding